MIVGVLLPVAALIVLAVLVPRFLERWTEESVRGLVVNGLASSAVMLVLVALYFFAAYLWRSSAILDLIGVAPTATVAHFLRLAAASAIIWAPVIVLTVASMPRRWKEAEW